MAVLDLLVLERVQWNWFISCTVATRGASDVFLTKKCFALLRWIARKNKLYFPFMPWALRLESGIDPEHRHFHLLVGGLLHIGISYRFATMHRWSYLVGTKDPENPKGTCRVRLYDGSRGAACYLASALNNAEYRGWSLNYVRFSSGAMWAANRAVQSNASGIGTVRHST